MKKLLIIIAIALSSLSCKQNPNPAAEASCRLLAQNIKLEGNGNVLQDSGAEIKLADMCFGALGDSCSIDEIKKVGQTVSEIVFHEQSSKLVGLSSSCQIGYGEFIQDIVTDVQEKEEVLELPQGRVLSPGELECESMNRVILLLTASQSSAVNGASLGNTDFNSYCTNFLLAYCSATELSSLSEAIASSREPDPDSDPINQDCRNVFREVLNTYHFTLHPVDSSPLDPSEGPEPEAG